MLLSQEVVALRGKVRLRVVHGHVNILGHDIRASDTFYPIYSPNSHCFMTMRSCEHEEAFVTDAAADVMPQSVSAAERRQLAGVMHVAPHASIVELRTLESRACDFITSFPSYANLFERQGDHTELKLLPDVSVIQHADVKSFRESSEFSDTRDRVVTACKSSELTSYSSRQPLY